MPWPAFEWLLHHVVLVRVMHEAFELQRDLMCLIGWALKAIRKSNLEFASFSKGSFDGACLSATAFDLQSKSPLLAASSMLDKIHIHMQLQYALLSKCWALQGRDILAWPIPAGKCCTGQMLFTNSAAHIHHSLACRDWQPATGHKLRDGDLNPRQAIKTIVDVSQIWKASATHQAEDKGADCLARSQACI